MNATCRDHVTLFGSSWITVKIWGERAKEHLTEDGITTFIPLEGLKNNYDFLLFINLTVHHYCIGKSHKYMHKKLIPLYQYISFYIQRTIYLHDQQELS